MSYAKFIKEKKFRIDLQLDERMKDFLDKHRDIFQNESVLMRSAIVRLITDKPFK